MNAHDCTLTALAAPSLDRLVGPLQALKELRDAISEFGGHGMPGFTDRAWAYIVIAQADAVLKRDSPNVEVTPGAARNRSLRLYENRNHAHGAGRSWLH